jgi:hypothetical protein
MSKARFLTGMLFFVLTAIAGSTALAQSTTSIRGVVTDPQGSALPGASVILTDTNSKTQREAQPRALQR